MFIELVWAGTHLKSERLILLLLLITIFAQDYHKKCHCRYCRSVQTMPINYIGKDFKLIGLIHIIKYNESNFDHSFRCYVAITK